MIKIVHYDQAAFIDLSIKIRLDTICINNSKIVYPPKTYEYRWWKKDCFTPVVIHGFILSVRFSHIKKNNGPENPKKKHHEW
jgi:hypothetical protein